MLLDPKLLSGLDVWLRADRGVYKDAAKSVPATMTGDLVYTWADQSGNGNDAVQSTAGNRPTFAVDAVNGFPAIAFNGSQYLPYAYSGAPGTIFVVGSVTNNQNNQAFLGGSASSNVGSYYFKCGDATHGGPSLIWVTSADSNPPAIPSNWFIWNVQGVNNPTGVSRGFFCQAARYDGITMDVWVQGRLAASTARTGTPLAPTGGIVGADYVGSTPSDKLVGSICEILIFNRALSLAEIQATHQYLARWFGGPVTGAFVLPTWGLAGSSDWHLVLAESQDGIAWTPAAYASYLPPDDVARDGGIWQDRSKNLWYFFHGILPPQTSARIAISAEGRFWMPYTTIDFSSVTGSWPLTIATQGRPPIPTSAKRDRPVPPPWPGSAAV
ncbi:MAG: hypothetical protein JWN24_2642 [Phycisphaerales bacterium]|nr:hypothetical protein [Phycisphaerales bacterium]